MKLEHEQNAYSDWDFSANLVRDPLFPLSLVDERIKFETDALIKKRFYHDFDRINTTLQLGDRLSTGELSRGSPKTRSHSLAWCARILAYSDHSKEAKQYLAQAQRLSDEPATKIAHALIVSNHDRKQALQTLAELNTPESRTVSLAIMIHSESAEHALQWLNDAGLQSCGLSPDGMFLWWQLQLKAEAWETLVEFISRIDEQDLDVLPILNYSLAVTHLLLTVPEQYRHSIVAHIPILVAPHFPLAETNEALNHRKLAIIYFEKAAESARNFGLDRTAIEADQYALWLQLRDPHNPNPGKQKLQSILNDISSGFPFLHLALQFKIPLKLDMVEREIERQRALLGGRTLETELAKLTLESTRLDPANFCDFISDNFEQLLPFFSKISLDTLRIQALIEANRSGEAQEFFARIQNELSDAEFSRLKTIIHASQDYTILRKFIQHFEDSQSLDDLQVLVNYLEQTAQWTALEKYALILFNQTRTAQAATQLARAFYNTGQLTELIGLIASDDSILSYSDELRVTYSWALYTQGELVQAKKNIEQLPQPLDNQFSRGLQLRLHIALGDWPSLHKFVDFERSNMQQRSATELLESAQLAVSIGFSEAMDLISSAARKGADDPDILAACYFLAIRLGRDSDDEVGQWLLEAARLSGAEGPICTRSLTDLVASSHDWAKHSAKIADLQCRSDIPISLAAHLTKRSLTDVTLVQSQINQSTDDVRFHESIPAFSGKRGPRSLRNVRMIGIDESALLTLAFLNLLELVLHVFEKTYLPTSIFEWLFQERFATPFHQPSRIRDAEVINALLTNKSVSRLGMDAKADPSLISEVGEDLAALISEAYRKNGTTAEQHVVVRPAPVYKQGILSRQDADLSDYSDVIADCKAVVDALFRKSKITDRQMGLARTYLRQQENSWPHEVKIENDAVLYLDHLAIMYLNQCDVLDKLPEAGFSVVVSESATAEADWLAKNQKYRGDAINRIEKIRSTLRDAFDSGLVEIGRRRYSTATDDHWMLHQPSVDLLPIAHHCQAMVSDDRFCNRHEAMHVSECEVPIYSSLDLLDLLVEKGTISKEDRWDYRHILRVSGYIFIPMSDVEIYSHLHKVPITGDRICETLELKTLRKYVLFVRMKQCLQHPSENPWLDSLLMAIVGSLRRVWQDTSSDRHIELRSNWILDLADCCGWNHLYDDNGKRRFTESIYATWFGELIRISDDLTDSRGKTYLDWVEDRALRALEEYDSDVYRQLLRQQGDRAMRLIESTAEELLADVNIERRVDESIIVEAVLDRLPSRLRESVIREQGFRDKFGGQKYEIMKFESDGIKIRVDLFFEGIRKFFAGEPEVAVRALDDSVYRLERTAGDPLVPTLIGDVVRIRLEEFVMFSTDRVARIAKFESEVRELSLPSDVSKEWRSILYARPLTAREYFQLAGEFRNTSVNYERRLANMIRSNRLTVADLVPQSKTYFRQLVGPPCDGEELSEYMKDSVAKLFDELRTLDQKRYLRQGLLLSAHPSLVAQLPTEELSTDKLGSILRSLISLGDCFSRVGGIEIALRKLRTASVEYQDVDRLIKLVQNDDATSDSSEIGSFVNLFVLVDGELALRATLGSARPYYRRLAALAHAAVVQQTMNGVGVDLSRVRKGDISVQQAVHHIQSLVDMRVEPFSNPGITSPILIRNYLLARIKIALKEADNARPRGQRCLDLGTNCEDQQTLAWDELMHLQRGPLQGGLRFPAMPDELRQDILRRLETDGAPDQMYGLLINASLTYAPDSELARAAKQTIRRTHNGFAEIATEDSLGNILSGLAIVAARSRCSGLAQELLGMVSRHRGGRQPRLEVGSACDIGLLAAASHEGFDSWIEFTGNWLTVVAFSTMKDHEPSRMNNYLESLLYLVPQLRRTCGRAKAAIKSLL